MLKGSKKKIDSFQKLLIPSYPTNKSLKINPAKIHYAQISHNANDPTTHTCDMYIKKDRSYVVQCDDGSVASGEKVAKSSVFGRYYKIVEGL